MLKAVSNLKRDGFFYYDTQGNQLLPCQYDHIDRVTSTIIRVVQNGNIGYPSPNGTWYMDFETSRITVLNQKMLKPPIKPTIPVSISSY
ncbi:MAG: hypothetical protein COA32_12035 [Fluviicola sp.]|nr:MAG: hypothetical protein COA32_12035 [Fluviicola sp.]